MPVAPENVVDLQRPISTSTPPGVTLGVLSVNGQTGEVSITANLLLPSQAGNSGKVLGTDGANASWVVGGSGGASSFSALAGSPSDNANLSAALAQKAGAALSLNQFAGGAGAYRILSAIASDEIDTRILGLTAGNTAQKLYSSGTVRSLTHLARAVDLTCISLQTSDNWHATAISPRHIVTAHHISPANGTTITFVTADGTSVSRTLSSSSQIGSTDIQIGLLSSDLPATIVPARVLSSSSQEATLATGSPFVFVDQTQKIFIGERNTSTESTNSFVVQQSGTSPRSTFWKSGGLVSGDSGGAIGAIIDGVYVALSEMHTFVSSTVFSGDSIARSYAAINSAMISLGGGYQLTPFKSQVLPAFLIGTQNAPLINSATGAYNLLDSATDSPVLTYNSDDAVYTLTAPDQFRTALSLGTITGTGTLADNKGASYGIIASDDGSAVLSYDATADGWLLSDPSTFKTALGLGPANTPSFAGILLVGTAGAGFIDIPAQSSPPSAPAASHIRLFNSSANKFAWIGASGFVRTFDGTLSASRTFTLPDADTKFPICAKTITFTGLSIDRTVTLPDASFTVARTDAANTFTGHQTIEGVTSTGATGTGAFVFATSPTLVTPLLGTPTSGVLTNCTGYTGAALVLSDVTTNNASTSNHGFLKKLDNVSTHFMDGTGAWSTPAGGVTSIATTSPISGGTITTTGTISLLTNVDFAFTLAQSLTLALAANTAGTGWLLTNTTAAAAASQRYSPAMRWTGQGWKTTSTAASQAVDFRGYVVPVQGTAAPTGLLRFESAINGGSFANPVSFTSTGAITDETNYLIKWDSSNVGIDLRNAADNAYVNLFINQLFGSAFNPTDKVLVGDSVYLIDDGYDVPGISLKSTAVIRGNSGAPGSGAGDIGLIRSALGVWSVNDGSGTASNYRDILARGLRSNAAVFASAIGSPVEGTIQAFTDSTTATWGATITGSGSNHVLGYYNGTNWTVMAK